MALHKYLASLVFTGCVLIASPSRAGSPVNDTPNAEASPTVAVEQVRVPLPGLREEAAMVLVGTALIALGAAVRRAA
jgi:hypothetical protein